VRGIVRTPCGDAGDEGLYVKQEMLQSDHTPSSQEYATQGGFFGHGMDLLTPHTSLEGAGREEQTGESRGFEPVDGFVL